MITIFTHLGYLAEKFHQIKIILNIEIFLGSHFEY